MKKNFVVVCALFLPFLSSAQTGWKTSDNPNYQIKYPSNWTLDKTGNMGSTFFVFAPIDNSADKFSENINLIIQDISTYKLDLDGYTKLSMDQIKKLISKSSLLESRKVKTATEEHQKVVYTGEQSGLRLKFEQYYWVIKSKAYVLTLTTELSAFEAYKKTGEAILDSFKIK